MTMPYMGEYQEEFAKAQAAKLQQQQADEQQESEQTTQADSQQEQPTTPQWSPGESVPEGYVVTTGGLASEESFKQTIHTPSGDISKEEYEQLQQQFPQGIPSDRIPYIAPVVGMESFTDRERVLKQSIENEEDTRQQIIEAIGTGSLPPEALSQYNESMKDIKAKKGFLDLAKEVEKSYREAGIEIPDDVKEQLEQLRAIAESPASPFVRVTDEGIIYEDLVAAEKVGIPLSEFEKMGFDPEQLKKDYELQKEVYAQNRDLRVTLSEIKDFYETHTELPDGQFINNQALEEVKEDDYDGYMILMTAGFSAYDDRLITLADGQKMLKKSFDDLPDKYRSIGLSEGFSKMKTAIDSDIQKYKDATVIMEKYKTEDGYDLLKAIRHVEPETMKDAGFDEADIQWATDAKTSAEQTGVALPGESEELKKWYRDYLEAETNLSNAMDKIWNDNPNLLDIEKEELVEKTPEYQEYINLTKEKDPLAREVDIFKRAVVQGTSTLFFAPARMALPEVKATEIKPLEYAVGTAQLATWAIPFMPKGVIPFASAGASSVFGTATAIHWNDMNTAQRVLSVAGTVAVALPLMSSVAKGFMPTAVKVPLKTGETATVWTGISVKGKPIVGISQGKPRIGTWGVERPSFTTIEVGYEPITKIETSFMGTKTALEKMGASADDIAKVESTLQTRALFAGKKSPYMDIVSFVEGTERLTPDEMAIILKKSVEQGKKVEQIYGSTTIKPQLAEELRGWRGIHDVDVQTLMTAEETSQFVDDLFRELQTTGNNYKIDPYSAGTILKEVDGQWVKITDIHAKVGSADVAPEGAYGMIHAETPVKIKLPEIGELKLMRLSESGKRKAASILEFQESGIAPPEHRINDISDYYVILRTFKGSKIADDWAEAYGFVTPEQKAALLKFAQENPPNLGAFILDNSPSVGVASPKVSIVLPPTFSASLPSSVLAEINAYTGIPSVPAMATLDIDIPSMPSKYVMPSQELTVPSITVSPSPTTIKEYSSSVSVSKGASSIPSPSMAFSGEISPSASVSPDISPEVSPSASPSPDTSPETSPYPSPFPSPSPVPSPSPIPSPPSPSPVPIPPSPSPPPYSPKPGGVIWAKSKKGEEEEITIKPGTVVWIQGRPKGGAMYRIVLPPYGEDNFYATREVPPGYVDEGWTGEGSVKESLQVIGGLPDHSIKDLDLGIARINITVEGGEPEIEFVSDRDSNTGDRKKTVGMGIGQIPIEEWEEAKAQGIEYQEFVRSYSGRRVGEKQEVKQEISQRRLQEIYDIDGEIAPDEEAWYEYEEPVVKTAKIKKKPVEPSLGENIYFGRRTLPNQYNGGL